MADGTDLGTDRAPYEIGGVSVAPGTRQVVDLPISVLANHAPVMLSVMVIHGARPGPTVFVSAALHGDEVLGVEIIRRLIRYPALSDMAGTLLAVPVVNAFGFLSQSRYLPDRRDLNRSFPGSAHGSLAAQLARLFLQQVVKRSDLGIDLHTAAIHRTNLPQLRLAGTDERQMRWAEVFAPPAILTGRPPEGSLRSAARRLATPILLYEAGEALRFNERATRVGLRGCLRVMHAEGMIGEAPDAPEPAWLDRASWTRAPQGGVVRRRARLGQAVESGDVLALVADPFGQSERPARSRRTGIVIGRSELSTANRGDALYNVAEARGPGAAKSIRRSMEAAMEDEGLKG